MSQSIKPAIFIKQCCLVLLLVNISACATDSRPPLIVNEAINNSPYRLHLLDIKQTVSAWKSFRPSQHVDTLQPPTLEQLKKLNVKELATQSAGMAITISQNKKSKPVHAYLLVYPIYPGPRSPASYRINISARDLKQARKGRTIRLQGLYPHRGADVASWIMWLSNQSLDVDCGCS